MNLNELLDRLNPEQREAALDIYGPSMVIAGPGAGKTHTLVVRTANMIANAIPAESIILFTFTNKAAREIKERVTGAIGQRAKDIMVGTYHSVCSRFLRKYADYVGLSKSYSILDPEDCKKVMKEVIKLSGYNYEVEKVLYQVSDYKCRLISPQNALRDAESQIEVQVAQIYQLYESKLLELNCVDFDNIIYKMVRLLENYPEVKEQINRQYQYIVADESHDSSFMDLRLIYLLTGENENICLIADNDQSIYKFRGAQIEAVINMRNIFPAMRTHLLNTNYRSTQTIVEASKSLISHNTQLVDKNLKSNNEVGNPIILFEEKDSAAEAARIVKLIKLCAEKHGYNYSDIAILYRMNYLSREIEEALLKYRIPYKIVGGTNFYSRKEIRDVMSYFRLIINPYDSVAFNRAINTPKRGFGEKTLEKINNYASANKCTMIQALSSIETTGKAKQSTQSFIETMYRLAELMDEGATNAAIEEMLVLTNYVQYIKDTEKTTVANDKIENLQELIEISMHFESIEDLSANMALDSMAAEENEHEENCVQLLTMHSSKGLEWEVVIIACAIEGVTPSYRATTSADIEEERRIYYVSCTRAKKLLFITRPKYTLRQGSCIIAKGSRFNDEINEDYMYRYGE